MRFSDINFRKQDAHWVWVTPTLAQKILDDRNYADNRKLSRPWIEHLARQMKKGLWKENAEPIIFDKTGHMINGQHRMTAILESGEKQKLLLATGVETEVFTTLDQGRVRSAGAVFGMKEVKNAHLVASICRKIMCWETNGQLNKRSKVSPDELLLVFDVYPTVVDDAAVAKRITNRVPVDGSMIGFSHHLFRKARPSKVVQFFEILETGVSKDKHCPVMALREKLFREKRDDKKRRWSPDELFSIIVKTWNAFDKGEPRARIILRRNADDKINLPTIRGLGRDQGNKGKSK